MTVAVVSQEREQKQRRKNLTLALLLAALVALFYVITIVKLSGNVS